MRRSGYGFIAASLLIITVQSAQAQRYRPPSQQGRGQTQNDRHELKDPEHGTVTGNITTIRFLPNDTKKSAMLTVAAGGGRTVMVSMSDQAPIEISGAQLTHREAKLFL